MRTSALVCATHCAPLIHIHWPGHYPHTLAWPLPAHSWCRRAGWVTSRCQSETAAQLRHCRVDGQRNIRAISRSYLHASLHGCTPPHMLHIPHNTLFIARRARRALFRVPLFAPHDPRCISSYLCSQLPNGTHRSSCSTHTTTHHPPLSNLPPTTHHHLPPFTRTCWCFFKARGVCATVCACSP